MTDNAATKYTREEMIELADMIADGWELPEHQRVNLPEAVIGTGWSEEAFAHLADLRWNGPYRCR